MQHEPTRLLVIDEDDATHAIIPILEQCGYILIVVPDEASIQKPDPSDFNVIVRGSMACQANTSLFFQVFHNTPVLVVTISNDTEDVIKCFELGAADYIGLPFHPQMVKARIDGYVGRDRLRRGNLSYVTSLTHRLIMSLMDLHSCTLFLFPDAHTPAPVTQEDWFKFAWAIEQHVSRLQNLIWTVKDLLRIETDTLRMEHRTVHIDFLTKRVIKAFKRQIEEKEQWITLETPPDLPIVKGDNGRLQKVINTLLGNAHHFTAKGGQIHISINHEPLQGVIHVAVNDTGIGIAPEHHWTIFLPYNHEANQRIARIPGFGDNLAIAKYIIEAHGGRIWFESTPGVGSTFHFTVPVAREQP